MDVNESRFNQYFEDDEMGMNIIFSMDDSDELFLFSYDSFFQFESEDYNELEETGSLFEREIA